MTPQRFRLVKHATAALFAVTVVGVLALGFDGLLRAMQKLSGLLVAPAPPAAEPIAEPAPEPGVVPAFVVPPAEDAPAPD